MSLASVEQLSVSCSALGQINISVTWGLWGARLTGCHPVSNFLCPCPISLLWPLAQSSPSHPVRHPGRAFSLCPGQLDRQTRSHRLNHPDWPSALIALTQQMPSAGMLSADRAVASVTVGRHCGGAAPSPDLPLSLSINRVFNKSLSGSPTNRL